MSYIHLTPFERSRLETLFKLGFSTRHIDRQLHRHHSTIARELKRHSLPTYCAELAQSSYHHRRLHVGTRGKKRKHRKPRETRGRFSVGTSIHKRPKAVTQRQLFGHWELETMVSLREKAEVALLPLWSVKADFIGRW